jgi:hypothetical protein
MSDIVVVRAWPEGGGLLVKVVNRVEDSPRANKKGLGELVPAPIKSNEWAMRDSNARPLVPENKSGQLPRNT